MEKPISASVNYDLKLYKCGIPLPNTSFCAFCCEKSASYKCQLWLEFAHMRKFYRKTRLFECCTVENPICATFNIDIKLHYFTSKHAFLCVLLWKISFVQFPTLTLNCTNALIHLKTRLFEYFKIGKTIFKTVNPDFKLYKCNILRQNTSFWVFAVQNPISANVNFDLKLQKCGIPQENTSFWVLHGGKSALYKCQLWL